MVLVNQHLMCTATFVGANPHLHANNLLSRRLFKFDEIIFAFRLLQLHDEDMSERVPEKVQSMRAQSQQVSTDTLPEASGSANSLADEPGRLEPVERPYSPQEVRRFTEHVKASADYEAGRVAAQDLRQRLAHNQVESRTQIPSVNINSLSSIESYERTLELIIAGFGGLLMESITLSEGKHWGPIGHQRNLADHLIAARMAADVAGAETLLMVSRPLFISPFHQERIAACLPYADVLVLEGPSSQIEDAISQASSLKRLFHGKALAYALQDSVSREQLENSQVRLREAGFVLLLSS